MSRWNQLLLFCVLSSAAASYKRWIPDTNFESASNWNTGVVPRQGVVFAAGGKVAVYVASAHTLSAVSFPVDGQVIFGSGAGFSAGDPGCPPGGAALFKDPPLEWFDPSLWVTAATAEDLHGGEYLFTVHEESVPCPFDDVVFRDSSSFRVDVSSAQDVPVKSVSVLGQTFTSSSDFSRYASSSLGRLQLQGSSSLRVQGSGCGDSTGCVCDNSRERARICARVKCEQARCRRPLRPVGHCCDVCGAIVSLRISSGFNFQTYRLHLQREFLSKHHNGSVRMAMSKVSRQQTQEIQVLLLDQKAGGDAGKLACDIAKDASSHGVDEAEVMTSLGSSGCEGSGGSVVAVVLGVVVGLALLIGLALLFRRGILKIPRVPHAVRFWGSRGEIGDLDGAVDHGFDNPMFDKPCMMPEELGLYGSDTPISIVLSRSGVHFVNPVFDETDFHT